MSTTELDEYPDRITEIFNGKNIFMTGGTGFIGKVFIEKIIRECPNLGGFYLLIREKKGKDPQSRLKEYFNNPLFSKLKTLHGNDILEKKCKTIVGDVSEKHLAISEEDRKFITENIDYIYHVAASVRFDEPLRNALLLNTRGTKYMIELGKECKRLELFCHVSTAYVHPEMKILDEKAYPPPADPHAIISAAENLSADIVKVIQPKLLGELPNTYTYTKALSEQLVMEAMDILPIVIVRPSVVISVWKEPLPGWGENINGPVGAFIGAGKGVVRSMYCNQSYYADFLPVDILANFLAIITWDYLTKKERRIYNFTSSDEIQITWKQIIDLGQKVIRTKMPFNNVPWYPGGSVRTSRFVHYVAVLFTQIIPAIFIDILLFCLGYKPVLCRVQKRIINGYSLLEHYTNNQWLFVKNNIEKVRENMNPREQKIYNCSKDGLDLEEYFVDFIHGARLYILNESDESLPAARRHMKIMWAVDRLFKMIMTFGILYLLYTRMLLPLYA